MQPYPFLLIFKLINRAFLMSAVTCGLDSVVLDPTDPQLLAAVKAVLAVNGKDEFCFTLVAVAAEKKICLESLQTRVQLRLYDGDGGNKGFSII
jgi:hypothetical protein